MRVLVTRTDRLGDVLMSLPSVAMLRLALPAAEIDFLCEPAINDAIGPWLAAERVGAGMRGKYDAALFLHAPGAALFNAWRAGVGVRVGMYSKPPSFLFLTSGIRQHRGRAERNEAEYNLELARLLLARLGIPLPGPLPLVEIPPGEPAVSEASAALWRLGLEGSFAVFHPGMGGSALNLTAAQYADLMEEAATRLYCPIAVTVGPAPKDAEMAAALKTLRPDIKILGGLSLPGLREVFRRAALVVAPSTGPLHLAHFVGTRTVGVYPPVRTQRPLRWAPWGGSGRSVVLSPDVECPGRRDCIGRRCPLFYCMDSVPWRDLLSAEGGVLSDFPRK